jgi:hypothetical protein
MVVSGLDAVAQPDVEEQPDSRDCCVMISLAIHASNYVETDRSVMSCRRVSLLGQCSIWPASLTR